MENMTPTPDDASAALADAETARARLTGNLLLPSFFFLSIGAALALHIATAGVAITSDTRWAPWLLAAGAIPFVLVALLQLGRFRRLNGVWVGGFASRAVLGTATASSVSYAVAVSAAVWAGFERLWWLVALCALAGGIAYVGSGRHWLRTTYRADPATHGRGEPAWQLAALGAAAVAGAVFLMIGR